MTIWFSPGGGLLLQNCTNVSITGGLAIDYTPTLAQGRVVDLSNAYADDHVFSVEFDERFLLPT